ncbi:slipin family protein [bacterium SCSIO 12741]|nr:slipin family protein [bacterium SCSIO 12741]
MIQVRINVGKVGIVTRKGDYRKTLTAGVHWVGFSDKVRLYDQAVIYKSEKDLSIMLRDEHFASLVEVLEVRDQEILLKYLNGNFDSVLKPGRYFYFKGLLKLDFVRVDLSEVEIDAEVDQNLFSLGAMTPYVRSFTLSAHEEGLLFVDGKLVRTLAKGTHYFWKNQTSVEVLKVDKRQQQLEISGQEILTRDKAALRINFYTRYRVIDTVKALMDNKDYEKQLYILMQLALREFIGTLSLDELLADRDSASTFILNKLTDKPNRLGVEVTDCGIRDIILPGEVKDILNQVLVAQKKAQANTITRREETASTRSLLNTAKLMEDNKMLYKLKEMEYVEKIAEKINSISVSGGNQVVDQLRELFS